MFYFQRFPELIGAPTIDGAFPLHMACAEGKIGIVKLLLNFKYPDLVRKLAKEASGNRMYRLGVPLNSKDGHGRTPLHVATMNNRAEVVKLLLRFKVPVVLRYSRNGLEEVQSNSPLSGEESKKIQEDSCDENTICREEIYPVEVDVLDLDGNTPLHIAVKGNGKVGYLRIASLLLQHKANPNKPFITPMGNCTPLMEACRMGNVDMMALLLKYGARDDNFQVLHLALRERNWDMVGAIIQHRSHMDTEYKINFMALLQLYEEAGYEKQDFMMSSFMTSSIMGASCMTSSRAFRSLWPSCAVVINWHSLNLPIVEVDWLYKACWQHTLRPPPDVDIKITLASVTRLDLSNNHLQILPPEIFQMPSLKMLNASKNHIEEITFQDEVETPTLENSDYDSMLKESNINFLNMKPGAGRCVKPTKSAWACLMLEEICFHTNKLRTLPADIFQLPCLVRANFSNNALESLPFEMWSSPALAELNLSRNRLSVLPMSQCDAVGGITINRPHPQDSSSIGSSYGSSVSSDVGTPQKIMITNPSGCEPLSPPRQSIPNPPSSLSLSSTNTSCPDSPEAVYPPVTPYQILPITYLNLWSDKIRVRSSLGADSRLPSSDTQSKLVELNLSHNAFQSIPPGVACLAPNLNKLNVSHNKLIQIGPLENYPAVLKWLDLSHNSIMSDTVFECDSTGDLDSYSYGSLPVKTCYNPHFQNRQIRR